MTRFYIQAGTLLVLIAFSVTMACVTGCDPRKPKPSGRLVEIDRLSPPYCSWDCYVLLDTDTGKQYLLVDDTSGVAICPMEAKPVKAEKE